jgi:hypothetical protein
MIKFFKFNIIIKKLRTNIKVNKTYFRYLIWKGQFIKRNIKDLRD